MARVGVCSKRRALYCEGELHLRTMYAAGNRAKSTGTSAWVFQRLQSEFRRPSLAHLRMWRWSGGRARRFIPKGSRRPAQ